MGIQAAILGASGYTGGEVFRYLAGHPSIGVQAVAAGSTAGRPLAELHPGVAAVAGDLVLQPLEDVVGRSVDVLFSCLPSGRLKEHDAKLKADLVIDLADDHRADTEWVYGLTEFCRGDLQGASRIANPGCYPTAVLLGLVPFVRAGVVSDPVVVDAMSGVSGAGRGLDDRLLFTNIEGGAAAYGAVPHRHVVEMERYAERFGGAEVHLSFTPHLIPVTRGLVATIRAKLVHPITNEEAMEILNGAYAGEYFVHPRSEWPGTKAVAGSNHVHVSARVDDRNGWLIASSAIDNLGKGAAGQAIQNANVALGLDETSGLQVLGVSP
ncbi:MAG TPA: N-acetyl-gamma-glutamyl-phosphate reductase [Actinomycetota bacterium]|nr:N-acetyl-gamma-glutamyl-phosphate reductase [Actinomycetota bacterium]